MASDDEAMYQDSAVSPSEGLAVHPDARGRVTMDSHEVSAGPPGADPVEDPPQAVSVLWTIGSIVVGVLLVAWFFVAWLALDRHFIDAAGESIGSAFAILLAASLVGAFRHNNTGGSRRPDRD